MYISLVIVRKLVALKQGDSLKTNVYFLFCI